MKILSVCSIFPLIFTTLIVAEDSTRKYDEISNFAEISDAKDSTKKTGNLGLDLSPETEVNLPSAKPDENKPQSLKNDLEKIPVPVDRLKGAKIQYITETEDLEGGKKGKRATTIHDAAVRSRSSGILRLRKKKRREGKGKDTAHSLSTVEKPDNLLEPDAMFQNTRKFGQNLADPSASATTDSDNENSASLESLEIPIPSTGANDGGTDRGFGKFTDTDRKKIKRRKKFGTYRSNKKRSKNRSMVENVDDAGVENDASYDRRHTNKLKNPKDDPNEQYSVRELERSLLIPSLTSGTKGDRSMGGFQSYSPTESNDKPEVPSATQENDELGLQANLRNPNKDRSIPMANSDSETQNVNSSNGFLKSKQGLMHHFEELHGTKA